MHYSVHHQGCDIKVENSRKPLCVPMPAKSFVFSLFVLFSMVASCLHAATSAAFDHPAFPLKVSENRRFLIDQHDRPFLVVGDTPWSLIVQLGEEEIARYLRDRHERGFNSTIVNLIEHKFCTNPPKTLSGLAPFNTPGDFSTPNSHYFDFARNVVRRAEKLGLVVWLAPAYLGYGGQNEGFFREMKAGGPEKVRKYGRFVGKHFKDLPNIVWLLGGDYTPPLADRWTVTELALGISEVDTNHLMTVHASPENSAASVFGEKPWLSLNTVYSYQPALFRPVLAEYTRQPARPFVLIESTYEGEHNSTPDQIRRQAYWAILGGACGQFFGNNPVWHFDGPGLFPAAVTWTDALHSVGSQDMTRLRNFFLAFPWHTLVPQPEQTLVTGGYATNATMALTAQTRDRKLSITYIPSTGTEPREIVLDTSQFPSAPRGRWFNPTTAQFSSVRGSTQPQQKQMSLRTPGDNGTKANDWLLVLECD